MPNDYITLKAITTELNTTLADGRINKINMPNNEEVIMVIRAGGANHALFISAASTMPRIHLTETKVAGGIVPCNFCMLLRKHVVGGVISSVKLLNADRVVDITLTSKNELHDFTTFHLIYELMGGGSNIILADENYVILEATRRMFGEGIRTILGGHKYVAPMQTKLHTEATELLVELDIEGEPKDKILKDKLVGLSKETMAETVAMATKKALSSVVKELNTISDSPMYDPCVQVDTMGNPLGFFVMPYATIGSECWQKTDSINKACDVYFSITGTEERKNKDTKALRHNIKKAISRAEKRLAACREKIKNTTEKDKFMEYGEILKCNFHSINKGDKGVLCYDFYNDKSITIPLDPKLSPQKNVEFYFKKYNKLKGAEAYATKDIEEVQLLLQYLQSLAASVETSSTIEEYNEIENMLNVATRRVQQTKQQHRVGHKKDRKTPPITLKIDGYTVYIGKNNQQNNEVTFNYAEGGDLWL
ncbi:MAG: NFACT family protein, partial [Bacillota bacterium]